MTAPRSGNWGAQRLVAVFAACLVLTGCQGGEGAGSGDEVGPGGRRQPLALNPQQELAVGRRAYEEVLGDVKGRVVPDGDRRVRRVRAVQAKLAEAAAIEPLQREILLRVRGYKFEWDVKVVDDEQVNAFCLPAGKMVVYTGLLPVAANDDQLATVLGHEMAHALAHHASERVARQKGGANILQSLRYDRMQESEADHVGVFLQAFAGYDPDEAVHFWERMRKATGAGGKPPEWLSDHPSDEHRVRDLKLWAPRARAAKQAFDAGKVAPAGR